jgi:hypothetical protein
MLSDKDEFVISIDVGPGWDERELDSQTHLLLDELSELNRVQADLIQGGVLPEGAKGDPLTLGTILVKIGEAGGIIGLTNILSSWLSRDERRSITLQIGENKLSVDGISQIEQTKLIEWFQTQTGFRLEP